MESAQPSRIIARKGVDETTLEDREPIAVDSFAVMMGYLTDLHDQPDFDAILERSRKTVTNVTEFIEDSDINEFIDRQSARIGFQVCSRAPRRH